MARRRSAKHGGATAQLGEARSGIAMEWRIVEVLYKAKSGKNRDAAQKQRLIFVQYSKLINPIFLV